MNFDLLQAFQTAVNRHGLGDENARVQMAHRDDIGACLRKVECGTPTREHNLIVRTVFKEALIHAFGVNSLDELPKEVKDVLKIRDFKLSKDGEVTSMRPLTMRRVKAVMGAVRNVAKSALLEGDEAKMLERATVSGFSRQDRDVMERAMSRIAIVSGRKPMTFAFPNGVQVSVPLSSLTAYTKSIPPECLASSIDDLHDQIQRDVKEGCAIYECLKAGKPCEHSVEAARKLRHYLSFMAVASGKGGNSRVVSVPDANGRVAEFLKIGNTADAKRLWANDSISGSIQRTFFVSTLECLGNAVAPMRQHDVEKRYRKLAENARASRVIQRKAEQGGFTIAQMYANVKAELVRISTVGYDELLLDARKELGNPKASDKELFGLIGDTKAFRDFCSYRCDLSEFLLYLQAERSDLDHPEMRIGDEIVLTETDLKTISGDADVNQVLSPRGAPKRREVQKTSSPSRPDQTAIGTAEWCRSLVDGYGGDKSFRDRFCIIVRCMRCGLHPDGKPPTQEYDRIMNADAAFAEFVKYIKDLDKEWLADFEWYVKSGAAMADNEAVNFSIVGPRRDIERPLWSALRRGVVGRKFPEHICREMVNLFKEDDGSQPFGVRLARRPLRPGMEDPGNGNIAAKSAAVSWGFGTYDVERILNYVKDCGFKISEVTAADLGKLSALAAVCDFRLEEAPVFIQRQTGKTVSELTTKDIESLFQLKYSGRLNDKGAGLKGVAGEIAAILKGEKLPSMTKADGNDVMHLLEAMRTLSGARPGSAIVTDFCGRKISLRLTLSGALVFNVGGFEFRSAKRAHEFVEMLEDDIMGHIDKYGTRTVFNMLPQIRGAEIPSDPARKSRLRELCLRYLKRSAGIDPSILASVSTREIFSIAEAVADDRYSLRSGKISDRAVRTMLDRVIDPNAMTSREAIELYSAIKGNLENVPGVEFSPAMAHQQVSQMSADVRMVHEFLADIVFDADPFDFEEARSGNMDMRVVEVMRRHVPALVRLTRSPALIATFPQDVAGGLTEAMRIFTVLLPTQFVRNVSDEELGQTFEFLLGNINKSGRERTQAVDDFVRLHPAPRPAQRPAPERTQGALHRIGATVLGLISSRPRPAAEPAEGRVPSGAELDAIKKEMLLATLDQMSYAVKDVDGMIERNVSNAMELVQRKLSESMAGQISTDEPNTSPVWSMGFEEIVGGAMTDSGSGYGKFMHDVISTYFTSSSPLDQRRMLASFIRHVDENASLGVMAGALFKGAGPLLQKMLQGLPPTSLGEDMAAALEDMKSNLLPLPDNYVKACMKRIIDRSGGNIRSVQVVRSLGAASVGQAFLCKMVTANNPEGEECVVKLLRPTVKTAIVRERKIFEAAAANVPGMSKTFEGQLARILDELDFTIEATNINFGRGVYEQPVYLRQRSLLNNNEIQTLNFTSLHSMEVHPLVTPTMDCLVLKKAPGVTYDRYMKDVSRRLDEMMEGRELVNGRYNLPNLAELIVFRKELVGMYNETLKRQRFLIDLTMKWAHEGLFGGGFYHGDLHAGNLMTDGNGLTVIDFGNATHLAPVERNHVLRMISAALVGWNDMFESSFKALLSETGRAEYDAKNVDGKISRDLAEVLKKGHGNDVGMRIAAALMLLQKHGIEVPGPIYNFNQCQMRLGGTVDAMNMLLGRLRSILTSLQSPRLVFTIEDGSSALTGLIKPAAKLINELLRFAQNPFAGSGAILQLHKDMEDNVFDRFSNTVPPLGEVYKEIMEELKDPEHCQRYIYPLIEQLQKMRTINISGKVMNDTGEGVQMERMFKEYLQKEEPTDMDRQRLAVQIYKVIFEMHGTAMELLNQKLDGREETFLAAVGESISDSLYTVRTTLGNITSVKLMNAQNAEIELIERERERMRESDLRVKTYRNARPDSVLDDYGMFAIKEVCGSLFFPFDLPGLDGNRKWMQNESSRRRVYEAMSINVKRLLAELEKRFVFLDQAVETTRVEATCIAMQYLADRFGGLFDAFKGADNRTQQRIMVELRQFFDERQAEGEAAGPYEVQCTMMAFLYLFQGGSEPAPEEPVPELGT